MSEHSSILRDWTWIKLWKFVLPQTVLFPVWQETLHKSKLYRTAATIRNIPSWGFLECMLCSGSHYCAGCVLSAFKTVRSSSSSVRLLQATALRRSCRKVIEKHTAVLVAHGCSSFLKYNVSAWREKIQRFIFQYFLHKGGHVVKNMLIYQQKTELVVAFLS